MGAGFSLAISAWCVYIYVYGKRVKINFDV